MPYSNKMMEDYMVASILAIENSQNVEEIKTAIVNMGYDDIRMQEGIAIHTKFAISVQDQVAARQDQYSKTSLANKAFKKAYKVVVGLVDLLRTTFEHDEDIMLELGLLGARDHTASGFITQSTHFYNTLLNKDKIFNKITKFRITKEILQNDLALVKDFEKANQQKINAQGRFQRTTEIRNKNYLELRHWMREFEKTCRIELKDMPQLIEQLGFRELSDIIKKRKKATTPPDGQTPTNTTTTPTTAATATTTPVTQDQNKLENSNNQGA